MAALSLACSGNSVLKRSLMFIFSPKPTGLSACANRGTISVKVLHDVHSFLAPNTLRGSPLQVHSQRFTPRGSLTDVHS